MAGNQVCVIEVTDLVELPTCSPASNVKLHLQAQGRGLLQPPSPPLSVGMRKRPRKGAHSVLPSTRQDCECVQGALNWRDRRVVPHAGFWQRTFFLIRYS